MKEKTKRWLFRNKEFILVLIITGIILTGIIGIYSVLKPSPEPVRFVTMYVFGVPIWAGIPTLLGVSICVAWVIHGAGFHILGIRK